MKYFIVYILAAIILWPAAAFAAPCANPAGDAGDQVYNTTYNVMQYCNGSHWVAMGSVMGQGDNLGNRTSDGVLNMSGFAIQNLSEPTNNSDAASKQYVDAALATADILPTCLAGIGLISTGTGWQCDYAGCILDGVTKTHGESHIFYSVAMHADCASVSLSRECNNGTYLGNSSFNKANCSPTVSINNMGITNATLRNQLINVLGSAAEWTVCSTTSGYPAACDAYASTLYVSHISGAATVGYYFNQSSSVFRTSETWVTSQGFVFTSVAGREGIYTQNGVSNPTGQIGDLHTYNGHAIGAVYNGGSHCWYAAGYWSPGWNICDGGSVDTTYGQRNVKIYGRNTTK